MDRIGRYVVVVAVSAWWPGSAGPSIVGPRELLVGQQGGYYAELDPGTGSTWTGPDGATQRGGELTVTAQAAGTLAISVRTDQGAESTIQVSVSESDDLLDGEGTRHDSATLVVRSSSAGVLTVQLVAELDDGVRRTVSHPVTVVL